jgi:glycine/D-amino acid oxidase-like deaminating enzyme
MSTPKERTDLGARTAVSRRTFLEAALALPALVGGARVGSPRPVRARRPRVVVVGAGAFGGWTALVLARRGAAVTLIDAWGPGNARSSSGGETRVIRAGYGPDRGYTRLATRALALWREHERRWRRTLFRRTGVLWMVSTTDDAFERAAVGTLRDEGIPVEELSTAEAARRYPQVDFDGVRWALFEPEAGFLRAREACQLVLDAFVAVGGVYRRGWSRPGPLAGGRMAGVELADGSSAVADAYVFACGPWLPRLFPDLLPPIIRVTRQEVIFLGTPAGDPRFDEPGFPVWADRGERFLYGVPSGAGRGFKVADDTRGPDFDPTSEDREPREEVVHLLREYVGRRFPALRAAPLLEARVCQYASTPDAHFIVDRHPEADAVWIVGGGSGHGFKHGPALGEHVAALVLGEAQPEARYSLESRTGPAGARP